MTPTIVNFASAEFRKGQERLRESLRIWAPNCLHAIYTEANIDYRHLPMYGFKIAAIERSGARRFLWLDSSLYLRAPLDELWRDLDRQGYAVQWNDPNCILGKWASDKALAFFNMTRDRAMALPDCMGTAFALDLGHRTGAAIFDTLKKAMAGGVFDGPRNNVNQSCSRDIRCLGHRYDQTALSLILHTMGLWAAPWETYVSLRTGSFAPMILDRIC